MKFTSKKKHSNKAKHAFALIMKEASAADFKYWRDHFPLALFLLLLDSSLADPRVNLIYKEQDVLNLAITKGGTKWLQIRSTHAHKNPFCASV